MVHEAIGGQSEQIIGHGYERFQSFVTCIFLFVLHQQSAGRDPGNSGADHAAGCPAGPRCVDVSVLQLPRNSDAGPVGYIKHFAGPVWWMAWLIFPIEIVSHLARVLSLTIRLYANMFASDLVTLVFFSLIPVAVPAIFHRAARGGVSDPGIRVHAVDHDLSVSGDVARALKAAD